MTRHKLAYIAIALCGIFALAQTWLLGDEYQAPWIVWLPMLGILGWSLWQIRERPDPKAKVFDFNPKRGILYFVLGFFIFPIMLALDAIFGANISIAGAALMTVGGSILIGLVGVFTEHVGV